MTDKKTAPVEELGTAIIDVQGDPLKPNPAKLKEVAVVGELDPMMAMIERLVTNPDVDIDKMERIIKMQVDQQLREAEIQFNIAMSACQGEMEPVVKTAEGDHGLYANLEAIVPAIKPIYAKHGFALSFGMAHCPIKDWVRVTCDITHAAGFSKYKYYDLPRDDKSQTGKTIKTVIHGLGSSTTYGRRYLTCLIFNIAVKGMDDDGKAAGGKFQPEQQQPIFITDEQVMSLETYLKDNDVDVKTFCKSAGIDTLNHLIALRFDMAMAHIEKKIQQRNKK